MRRKGTRRVRAFDVPASVVAVHPPDVTLVFVEIEPVPVIHATPFGSSVAEKLPALLCQRIAERRSTIRQLLLLTHVFGAARGSFDTNGGGVPVLGEVVWARAHVEFTGQERVFEAPHHQVGIDEWQQFEAPLVQVHTGVQAARLFVIDLSFACKRERVLGGAASGVKNRNAS